MSNLALTILLSLLFGTFVFLLGFNIALKLWVGIRGRLNQENKKNIISGIQKFINSGDAEFKTRLEEFSREIKGKGKTHLALLDEYLLSLLDQPEVSGRDRIIEIARKMDFISVCMAQIKDRHPQISALASRRAGLYRFSEATDEMIGVLDIMTSENQFEILMAIARIGDGDAMWRAFEKIKKSILINERSVIEILNSFSNAEEKEKLFRAMYHGDTEYVTALFLKATDRTIAKKLTEDIREVLRKGNKEVRIAAVRALGSLGVDAPADDLIHALQDSDWEIRAMAAKALGSVTIDSASNALYAALFDKIWWVRQNSATALMKHPGYDSLFILAAESGDKYTIDSIIYALDNGDNYILLKSIRTIAA